MNADTAHRLSHAFDAPKLPRKLKCGGCGADVVAGQRCWAHDNDNNDNDPRKGQR